LEEILNSIGDANLNSIIHLFISDKLSININERFNIIHADNKSLLSIVRSVKACNPEKVFFLNIDNNIALFLTILFSGMNVYGISFNSLMLNGKSIKRQIKALIFRTCLYFSNLIKIFIVEHESRTSKKLQTINELLIVPENQQIINLIKKNNYVKCEKFVISIIGYIQKRKGVEFILDVLNEMYRNKDSLLNTIEFRITGKISEDMVPIIQDLTLFNKQENFVVISNSRLSEIDFHKNIYNSNLILLLYNDHHSSSSVLFQAAYWKVPVFAFENTLIGKLVSKHNTGYTIKNNCSSFIYRLKILISNSNTNRFNYSSLVDRRNNREFGMSIRKELFLDA